MTTIRATCPECGEVGLTPDDIRLTVVRGADSPVGPDSHYTFTCPICRSVVNKPADERVTRLLTTGGVTVNVIQAAPVLPPHPEDPPGGAPFGHDDVLDLHLLLLLDDWFEHLLSATTTGRA
ncbi:MAG: hypothetical protein KY462_10170 [Actinobacteria bacterium]|nr:hypothetical protein [Actinomycetota bacterium]